VARHGGYFNFNTVTATTTPLLPAPDLLNSNSLNIGSNCGGELQPVCAIHTLDIWITARNLTGNPGAFQTDFTQVGLTPGWTETSESLISLSNAQFTGSLLSTFPFTTTGGFTEIKAFDTGGATYSLTTHYTIVSSTSAGAVTLVRRSPQFRDRSLARVCRVWPPPVWRR
jgi:hypothetical protein